MVDGRPTWMLVIEAAERLTAAGHSPFKLSRLITEVQAFDWRARDTIQPVVQGMTLNAGKGPESPCGKPLRRVDRGYYKLSDQSDSEAPVERPRPTTRPGRRSLAVGRGEVRKRVESLIAEFDPCAVAYDRSVPFSRSGQYEFHRRTIDRRLALGSVAAAVHDEQFTELLYETLQRWGIGRRASRLVPLREFQLTLASHEAQLVELEPLNIESLDGNERAVSVAIDSLVSGLSVVDNKARIVAGTKTLHHLLPDLVPPMDRAWTGAFFGWSLIDPQNNQTLILGKAFSAFAEIAGVTHPSRLVGDGWRTSSTKLLDNALIGYCKLEGIGGTQT
jgi:hypothetical protein